MGLDERHYRHAPMGYPVLVLRLVRVTTVSLIQSHALCYTQICPPTAACQRLLVCMIVRHIYHIKIINNNLQAFQLIVGQVPTRCA